MLIPAGRNCAHSIGHARVFMVHFNQYRACGLLVSHVCMYVCTVCMYVQCVCVYSVYVCTVCMCVQCVCMYSVYVCTVCMYVQYVCMYSVYVCTVCMYVQYVCVHFSLTEELAFDCENDCGVFHLMLKIVVILT